MDIKSQSVTTAAPWKTRAGNFLRLISCTLPVDVTFFYNSQPIAKWEGVTGGTAGHITDPDTGRILKFDTAEIDTSADQTIKAAVGFGNVEVTATSVTVAAPTVIDTVADVALAAAVATEILPADTTRRAAIITNLAANVTNIRAGDSNTGAARGCEVAPGQSVTLEGQEAIYGYSVPGQSVGVTIIKD